MRLNIALASVLALAIVAVFYKALASYVQLATSSDLYSHTLLIPPFVAYLFWDNRPSAPVQDAPKPLYAVIPALVAAFGLFCYFTFEFDLSSEDGIEDYAAYTVLSVVALVVTFISLRAKGSTVKRNLFPLFLLFWTAPFPSDVKLAIQTFFQHASADLAYLLIDLAGVPIYREGLLFDMPTIRMEVAPQCSGIRSSLVLFIVSMCASYLFLKGPWKRTALVALVVPLGIARNGIRILVLALQCYHIGPEMIHGWFHKHGGQPLFAITLLPLFAALYLFWRSERNKTDKPQ